jgi:hypothetical protein
VLQLTVRAPNQLPNQLPSQFSVLERSTCPHVPRCPSAGASDHAAARVRVSHPDQGWSVLCNGVVLFDDLGEILPDGTCVAP